MPDLQAIVRKVVSSAPGAKSATSSASAQGVVVMGAALPTSAALTPLVTAALGTDPV